MGNAAAFYAFMDKIFDDDAPAFDPVCLSSLEEFIESYNAGDDLLTANLKSARAFFKEFSKGSSVPADSPCAAATLAYTREVSRNPALQMLPLCLLISLKLSPRKAENLTLSVPLLRRPTLMHTSKTNLRLLPTKLLLLPTSKLWTKIQILIWRAHAAWLLQHILQSFDNDYGQLYYYYEIILTYIDK